MTHSSDEWFESGYLRFAPLKELSNSYPAVGFRDILLSFDYNDRRVSAEIIKEYRDYRWRMNQLTTY